MSTKVLVFEDDHGQREAAAEIISVMPAFEETAQKARQFKATDFLANPFQASPPPLLSVFAGQLASGQEFSCR